MSPAPAVSVIIPARNAEETISAALRSAFEQDYEGPWEVIVAEGRSHDRTRQMLEDLALQEPRLRVVDNPTGKTPAALNRALAEAHGEVIVRCDAHAELPTSYLSTAVAVLSETGADNVGGAQAAVGNSWMERAIALAMTSPLGAGDSRHKLGGRAGPTDTVYLGVYRRSALERVGGFDEGLERNQDYELNIRIRTTGGTVYFHPDLAVRYRPRGSIRSLWRQYFDFGSWKRVVIRRHPGSIRWRQMAAPALVAGLALSILVLPTPARSLGLIVPAGYVFVLLSGAAWLGIARREPAAVLLPLVIPTMHLAWGLGFLKGLDDPHVIDQSYHP